MDSWIPIFRSGKQTDSQGREHDGSEMIDKAVANFDAKTHEPPVTIGHPKDNAPAFGWVEGLKRQGEFLMAKFKDLQPEFVDMVKRGLFKKRSASFYPDGSLRHVGFLGAAPPAVKGLPDVAFKDREQITFEFSAHDSHKFGVIGRVLRSLREMLIGKFGEETANKVVDNFDIDFLTQPAESEEVIEEFSSAPAQKKQEEGKMTQTFTEYDLKQAKEKAAQEERKSAESEFAEKDRKNQDRIDALQKENEGLKEGKRKESIKNFTEGLKKEGKYPPSWDKLGLPGFMEKLDGEEPVEFSEGKKQTPLDFMKGFLGELPKTVNFKEISGGTGPEATDDHEPLIRDFMEKNNVDYKTAAIEISKLRPELFK